MNGRNCLTLACQALILLVLHLPLAHAATTDTGYMRLSESVRKDSAVQNFIAQSPNKVQVLEFFSYGCSACAKFEPAFEKWIAAKQNKNVSIYRVPVSFNKDDWQNLANLYYIMRTLDPKEELNEKIFTAIHQQGQRLWEESAMRSFFEQNGYNETQFDAAYAKYGNGDAAKTADKISDVFGINSTPTVIVTGPKGSYMLTVDQTSTKYFDVLNQAIAAAK